MLKTNAAVSRAIRTNGLRLVPADIVDEAMDLCIETARLADENDPETARKKVLDAFDSINVTPADLKQYGVDPGKLGPAELEELRGIYTAIASSQTTWKDVLAEKKAEAKEDEPQAAAKGAKSRAKSAAAKAKGAAAKGCDHPDGFAPSADDPDGEKSCVHCGQTSEE